MSTGHGLAVLLVLGVGCGDSRIGGGDDAADAAEPAANELFDEAVIRTYELAVAPADWDYLNAHATEEMYVPASLTLDGETVAAAVRYKGSYGNLFGCFDGAGNQLCAKVSFKLSFNEVDASAEFHGVRKLNLHGMNSDPSKMHDAIGYKLFRDRGVPAPRTAYARLVVNGESRGLVVVVENVDGRFARARFPDGGEGNVYQDAWPSSSDPAFYRAALRTNEDDAPSVDRMVRFAAALAAAGDDGFVAALEAWTDVDQLMQYFAVARLIDHWDDVVAWYCSGGNPCVNHNYFWYESTTEDHLSFIAWDLDNTFQEPSPIRTQYGMPDWDDLGAGCDPMPVFSIAGVAPSCDPLLRRVVTQLWDRYAAASQDLIAGDFAPAAMKARVDQLAALLEGEVAADPDLDPAAWRASVNGLRAAIDAKRAYIAAKLAR